MLRGCKLQEIQERLKKDSRDSREKEDILLSFVVVSSSDSLSLTLNGVELERKKVEKL